MNNRNDRFKLDFMPIGQDIKRGREAKDVTREQLSEITGYAPRHIFGDRDTIKSSIRRRVDTLLDGLADKDLVIVEAVIKGIHQAGEMSEK